MDIETTAKAVSHHRHTDYPHKDGEGFRYLGSGSWRIAYLGDDGFVYKVDHGDTDHNLDEFRVYMRVLEMELPEWLKIPAVTPVGVSCGCGRCPDHTVVNVMDFVDLPTHQDSHTMPKEDWDRGISVPSILKSYDLYPGYSNLLYDRAARTWWPVDMQMDAVG